MKFKVHIDTLTSDADSALADAKEKYTHQAAELIKEFGVEPDDDFEYTDNPDLQEALEYLANELHELGIDFDDVRDAYEEIS